ncbi:50S ribosomal protein L16 [archaeon]|nr:50S ribosomal protein L16 [archaeon]
MVRKPGRMYREIRGKVSTRKKYMGGVPQPKIVHFDYGNLQKSYPFSVTLAVKEKCQIRHSALEAARIAANKYAAGKMGENNYYLKIRLYPHAVLRENKQATGAGADRVSQGMRKSFGKPVSTAARVKTGQKVMTLNVEKEHIQAAKEAMQRAKMKIPSSCSILIEERKP